MEPRIRVLIADDSAFSRLTISRRLEKSPEFEIIGFARDGMEAVEITKALEPDVITMDVTMPRMDGLDALRHIMAECPTPVVMVSALTGPQTGATIEALELGAVDFYLKASAINAATGDNDQMDLAVKIKQAAAVPLAKLSRRTRRRRPLEANSKAQRTKPLACGMCRVVVIASSTGGPRALTELVPGLPADLPAAVLIVQHMPEGFTRSMAERLDQTCHISVSEAEEGDALRVGHALVAPGGYHTTVNRSGGIELNQWPPVWGVRPAADVTMKSVAAACGASTIGVVLTGMGRDGTNGAGLIRAVGGSVVAEDESTCTVFGMPKSAIEAGNADAVLPIDKIAEEIVRCCAERPDLVTAR